MKKIAFALVPFLGVALAKAEAPAVVESAKSEVKVEAFFGPGKGYRSQLARSYFGKRAGCRRGGFCGR